MCANRLSRLEQLLFANLDSVSKSAFVDLTATDLEASSTGALTLQLRKAESWKKNKSTKIILSRDEKPETPG